MNQEKLFLKGNDLYEAGEYENAFSVFLDGANSGDTSCMTRVASMYTSGEGIECCDYDKALHWEMEAANKGDSTAYINIGITYRLKGDLKKSRHWFERAIDSGDESAAIELAKLYMVSDKETETIKKYLELAVSGSGLSEYEIEEAEQLLSNL